MLIQVSQIKHFYKAEHGVGVYMLISFSFASFFVEKLREKYISLFPFLYAPSQVVQSLSLFII